MENEVSADEVVLRRFNPLDPNHVAIDEGTGILTIRSGAVSLTQDNDGLSVFRSAVLAAHGLSESSVAEPPYVGIAWFVADVIRKCDESLGVRPDPWPNGTRPTPHRDAAHALVTCNSTRSAARKISSRLARLAARVEVPSPDETRRALS